MITRSSLAVGNRTPSTPSVMQRTVTLSRRPRSLSASLTRASLTLPSISTLATITRRVLSVPGARVP